MATITGNNLLARARTLATQTGGDPNSSQIIDNLGGLRAWLNSAIREVYRRKSTDQKFIRDIMVRHTVAVVAGSGACPDSIMREFLHASEFADANDALISYMKYNIDQNSGQTFDQLGYVTLQDDNFKYRAPSPDLTSYSGDLYVTAPTFPTLPDAFTTTITFPSEATIDDVVALLALSLTGNQKFEVISA